MKTICGLIAEKQNNLQHILDKLCTKQNKSQHILSKNKENISDRETQS